MTDWFRSWHGAPTDPKWLGIARKAGIAPGIVVAIAWALMDRASQSSERGSIEGYDADGLAYFFGCEPEQVEAAVVAMGDKGILVAGRFSNWEKRQPRREDGAAERAKEWRERKRTQANAVEPPETEVETETETERSNPPASVPEPEGARVSFDQVWEAFPRNPTSSETKALTAFNATKVTDRQSILAAALAYVPWFRQDCVARKRTVDAGLKFVPHLANWITDGSWRTLPAGVSSEPSPDLVVLSAGDPDFAAVERLRGKRIIVGDSGRATISKAELEKARTAA